MTRRYNAVQIVVVVLGCLLWTVPVANALIPRAAWPKPQTVTEPAEESFLIVKFQDHLKFRVTGETLWSAASPPATDALAIVDDSITIPFEATYQQLIQLSAQTLADCEIKAALRSGRAQPDFAGIRNSSSSDDRYCRGRAILRRRCQRVTVT